MPNKYNAQKTVYNGYRYDSKFEASIAQELDLRVRAKDISAVEKQHTIKMDFYTIAGNLCFSKSTKVDFLITENDGSLTLYEAKGFKNRDFKNLLDLIRAWLKYSKYDRYILREGSKETTYR